MNFKNGSIIQDGINLAIKNDFDYADLKQSWGDYWIVLHIGDMQKTIYQLSDFIRVLPEIPFDTDFLPELQSINPELQSINNR